MKKRELLDKRPLMPKLSLVGYALGTLISIILIVMGTIVLSNNINFDTNGVEVEATVVSIVESDTERSIYITYEYDGVTYSNKKLKYWSDELDLENKITIKVLKNDPEQFKGDENYYFLAYVIYGIALILLALCVRDFIVFYIEEKRIYNLLISGEKKEGIIAAVEQMSERNFYGTLPWCITAKIGDKVYNGCKNYIKFSLNGSEGYNVDIYIDKNNPDNFYIDLISIRKNEDSKIGVMKMNKNRLCFTCTCLRSYETIMSFKPLFKEGFGGVEIFYPYNVSDEQKETYTKAVTELIKDEDLTMVMHLPYGDTSDLARYDEPYQTEILNRYMDAIDYGKKFGVVRYTLHLGERSTASIDKLITKLQQMCDRAYPADIMIENMPGYNEVGTFSDEFEFLFKEVNRENIKLIYDTGHGHVAMKNTAIEKKFLDDLAPYLTHFHINDNDTTRDMHAKIGVGTVEFEKLFAELHENNYRGLFCLEILFNTVDDLREYASKLIEILKNVNIL